MGLQGKQKDIKRLLVFWNPPFFNTCPATGIRLVVMSVLDQLRLIQPNGSLRCYGYGSKMNHQGTAGLSPCFHFPGFHFGYIFLTHCHMGILPKVRPPPFRWWCLMGFEAAAPNCSRSRPLLDGSSFWPKRQWGGYDSAAEGRKATTPSANRSNGHSKSKQLPQPARAVCISHVAKTCFKKSLIAF